MTNQTILQKVEKLYEAWKRGLLGGEKMPEDENPCLPKDSFKNVIYFTLPMALNYQRNSYKLWEAAKKTFEDEQTNFVFDLQVVIKQPFEKVQTALIKYKLALQPNKQTETWLKLAKVFNNDLFVSLDYDIAKIKNYMQVENKKDFPYLSGNKICNYWLYVLTQYTNLPFKNKQALSIAPDTHVVQASIKLGVVKEDATQEVVAKAWEQLLKGTKFLPIDIHTPLWLWSRGGFRGLL